MQGKKKRWKRRISKLLKKKVGITYGESRRMKNTLQVNLKMLKIVFQTFK